jgi:hypothetical protein
MFLVPSVTALLGHAAWWPGHVTAHGRPRLPRRASPPASAPEAAGQLGAGRLLVMDVSEIEVRDEVGADSLPSLMDLFAAAWWTTGRTTDDAARMLAASDLVVALVYRSSGRLVGFARVITDEAYRC